MDRNQRAIIVEDDQSIRLLLERVLCSSGYSVVPYTSPTDATIFSHPEDCPLAAGREELFDTAPTCADLIITDVDMPKINGIEYIRAIRRAGCKVRHIAIMSGNWNEEDLLEAQTLGCKCFFKPFSMRELREWLSTLIG